MFTVDFELQQAPIMVSRNLCHLLLSGLSFIHHAQAQISDIRSPLSIGYVNSLSSLIFLDTDILRSSSPASRPSMSSDPVSLISLLLPSNHSI